MTSTVLLLPGRSQNVPHAPGRAVGPQVRAPLRVLVGDSNPKFCPIVHLDLPVMSAPHRDQIPQHSYTPVDTHTPLMCVDATSH